MENELVAIEHNAHDAAITALVRQKENFSAATLTTNGHNVDEILRTFYAEGSKAGLVLLINLAIRSLGAETSKRAWELRLQNSRGVEIIGRHSGNTGTTRVEVGGLCVLSNESAGSERLQPGEWLYTLHEAYKRRNDQEAWAVEIEATKAKGQKIADFLADV